MVRCLRSTPQSTARANVRVFGPYRIEASENSMLDVAGFDKFCEEQCRDFYHTKLGRPSLAPGVYFRLLLIGFFEGIGSERGIGWRVADSLSLRRFLNYGLAEATPDHV